jgi:hypothetical protein
MTNLRADIESRVSRKVIDVAYAWTVFLHFALKQKYCRICKMLKPLSAFYSKSKTHKKHDDDVRDECIECWDAYNGKDPNRTSPMTNDLCEFIDNGENDERTILVGGEVSAENSRGLHST